MVTSTVRPPMATPTPVPALDNGSRSVNISTTPRPMAATPKRTAEAVATRLAAALRAAERARACTVARWRLAHWYSMANTASASAITTRPGPGATKSTTPTARITVPTTVTAIRRSSLTRSFTLQACQHADNDLTSTLTADRPIATALMPGISGYLPCGCERTAGTSATAIASETTAQTAPTAKARAKSWLPSWAATRPAPAALDRTATPAAPPS